MRTLDTTALRLAAVVASSDDAIISHSRAGLIETWNRSAERLFGYTADEAVGRPIDLVIPLTASPAAAPEINGGHLETHGRRKDGTTVEISVATSSIYTPEGEPLGVSRIVRDITEQKALQREAFRLKAIVDSSEDAIVSKNLDGIVQTWNRAAERMFGYAADEIVGRSILMIIPPERRGEEDQILARIRAGQPISNFETVRRRKDGSSIDISLTVSPIYAADGTVIGASKIARDVSRQKAMEREAFRLAAIVDSSEDAIVSKDLQGIVQTWNRAAERMFGFTAEEMIGQSITRIIPPERLDEETQVLARVRAGLAVEHFETIRRRKDGTDVEVSLTVSPIRAADDSIIGASKIARDISLQHRLAREAEEASRVKDEFLATLSHELRTPLNAVLGYTRMLRDGHFSGGRETRAIDTIERNAAVLSQLVSDVLDVSAIVTGKMQLKRGPCDLAGLLHAAADMVRPSADAKGVELRVTIDPRTVPTTCDGDRLQQVFWNLLSNAVKFTPSGGRVSVRLSADDNAALVTVTDTGAGIPAASLPYVFQRFWQGESTAGRHGLGLGLALARHFTELHGGTISAASEGAGKGATFTVALPRSA